jgi:hypothetical protein
MMVRPFRRDVVSPKKAAWHSRNHEGRGVGVPACGRIGEPEDYSSVQIFFVFFSQTAAQKSLHENPHEFDRS